MTFDNYTREKLKRIPRLEKAINDNLRTLKSNIGGETKANEKTMTDKLDKISKNFEEYKNEMNMIVLRIEKDLTAENEELTYRCNRYNQIKKLSPETLEIYNLYESLMDLYNFGEDVLDIQRIRSIGNIVSSFVSKENKKEAEEEEIEDEI